MRGWRRWLLLALCLSAAGAAPMLAWKEQGVALELVNPEVTVDNQYVLVHFRLRADQDVAAFHWREFCLVRNAQGESLPMAGDCGVDMKMTTGAFPMKKGRRATLMIYFFSRRADFPARLEINGQPVGKPLTSRR